MGRKKDPNLKPDAFLDSAQRLISTGLAHAINQLPQLLDKIRVNEMWRHWRRGNGEPFASFTDALVCRQPHGLGMGQYQSWVRPFQAYHLCDGYPELQAALRPMVAEAAVAIGRQGGARKGGVQPDNIRLTSYGTGEEYLLARLKRHDAENGTDYVGEWARGERASIRAAAIAAGIVKPKESDLGRSPIRRIAMYWNRATAAERKVIAKMISKAGGKEISDGTVVAVAAGCR